MSSMSKVVVLLRDCLPNAGLKGQVNNYAIVNLSYADHAEKPIMLMLLLPMPTMALRR